MRISAAIAVGYMYGMHCWQCKQHVYMYAYAYTYTCAHTCTQEHFRRELELKMRHKDELIAQAKRERQALRDDLSAAKRREAEEGPWL